MRYLASRADPKSFDSSTENMLSRLFGTIVGCRLTAGRLRLLGVLEASVFGKIRFEHDPALRRSELRPLALSVQARVWQTARVVGAAHKQ